LAISLVVGGADLAVASPAFGGGVGASGVLAPERGADVAFAPAPVAEADLAVVSPAFGGGVGASGVLAAERGACVAFAPDLVADAAEAAVVEGVFALFLSFVVFEAVALVESAAGCVGAWAITRPAEITRPRERILSVSME
jgi:hypothetical protein